MTHLYPLRCSNCNRLLGYVEGRAIIKCSRCNETTRYFSEWTLADVNRRLASSNMNDDEYVAVVSELILSKSA